MGSRRNHKRKSDRLIKVLQSNFTKLTESYVSSYLELTAQGHDDNSEEVVKLFVEQDRKWKKSTWILMTKHPGVVHKDRTQRVLDRFTDFADKFHQRKELHELDHSVKALGIDKSKKLLKLVGIETQAKTESGLQKRVDQLDDTQLAQYRQLAVK